MKITTNEMMYNFGQRPVLTNINWEVQPGITAIVGPSGSGKSTLAMLINGLERPSGGTIFFDEVAINSKTKYKQLSKLRKSIAHVIQFSELQLFKLTVEEELMYSAQKANLDEQTALNVIKNYFMQFALDESVLTKSIFALSGGQQKKVAIISMLLLDPQVLILDEPTVSLDKQSQIEIIRAINKLKENNVQMIVISHDINFIAQIADQVIKLKNQTINLNMPAADFFQYMLDQKKIEYLPDYLKICVKLNLKVTQAASIKTIDDVVEHIKEHHANN